MRVHLSLLVAAVIAGPPGVAWSHTSTGAVELNELKASLKEELRNEIREELKDELKAEIKSELQGEGASSGPVEPDAWAEEQWKWEEPVKPELNFLEFDGYLRLRSDLFKNLDLDLYYYRTDVSDRGSAQSGPYAAGTAPPTSICNTDVGARGQGVPGDANFQPVGTSCANTAGESETLAGANMRLRLEPVFNVYEDIKIKMQLDLLDNLVLGSTPDAFPGGGVAGNPMAPISAFTQGQVPPSDGVNALLDSIRVKRAWAEVMTPLGQLRFGRMPSHFGMGILANEGRGLDSDYGDTADRILFATKLGDFHIVPAFDWAISGPTSASRLNLQGQPFDREQRDDVDQYILAVVKRDKDEEIKEKLESDEIVLNYGTYQVLRFQALDAASYFRNGDPGAGPETSDLIERDVQAWIYSLWVKFIYRKLSLEAEYAGILGTIGNRAAAGRYSDPQQEEIDVSQHGLAINAEYKFLRDALTLRLLLVAASGDRANGWGLRPFSNPAAQPGDWDGSQVGGDDKKITNFRFDPDFVVDMILWRELVGTVTDALVIRPGVQYNLTEGFGASLDLVYSRAWFAQSTPSASKSREENENLGIESDLKIFYGSDDGFHAWLQYGLFIPLPGLDRRVLAENNVPLNLDAGIAQTIQVLLAVSF